MINLAAVRAELASLVDRFKEDAHALLAKVEGQAVDDAHTIEQQAADDVHTVESDLQQATTAATGDQSPTP